MQIKCLLLLLISTYLSGTASWQNTLFTVTFYLMKIPHNRPAPTSLNLMRSHLTRWRSYSKAERWLRLLNSENARLSLIKYMILIVTVEQRNQQQIKPKHLRHISTKVHSGYKAFNGCCFLFCFLMKKATVTSVSNPIFRY